MSRTADALREKCLLNDERHDASQAEIEALHEALRQAEANFGNEQTKRNNFELRYQREKAALDNRVTELEQLNASLLADLEGRDQSLADFAAEKSAHQAAAEALKQQKQVLLISVQQLERDVEESAHRTESLRHDVATLQSQRNQVSNWQTFAARRLWQFQTFSCFLSSGGLSWCKIKRPWNSLWNISTPSCSAKRINSVRPCGRKKNPFIRLRPSCKRCDQSTRLTATVS